MRNKYLFIACVFILLALMTVNTVFLANSAEPPAIVIIVSNPPGDLTVKLDSGEREADAHVKSSAWETYYSFYTRDKFSSSDLALKVTTGSTTTEYKLPTHNKHRNMYTLDLKNQTLTDGKTFMRSVILVSTRVILTLIIEGIIFLLFGFGKSKRNWIAFFVINLVTQGILNIWLDGIGFMDNYLIFSLIGGEFLVFIAEMVAFPIVLKDKKVRYRVIYAFVANLASLFLGGYLINLLPV